MPIQINPSGKYMLLINNIFPLAFIFILQVSGLSQSAPRVNSDGAMHGSNLQRTRTYSSNDVNQLNSVLWKSAKLFEINYAAAMTLSFDGSGTISDIGFSDPIMVNGILYFQLCMSLKQNFILALDSKTGRLLWTFKSQDPLSAPAIAGNNIFVVSGENCVYALELATGNEKWKFANPNKKSAAFSSYAAPAVHNGVIYFTSLKGELYALDIESHQPLWVFQTKGILTAPAFDDKAAYFGTEKGILQAVDLITGKEKWSFKAKGELGIPVVANETIYFRSNEGILYSLEKSTGQQLLATKVGGKAQLVYPITSVKIGTDLAFENDTIYFGGEDKGSSYLFAIQAKTGQEKWKFKLPEPGRAPIVAGNIVYAGGLGSFHAIDARTGTEKWSLEAKSKFHDKQVKNVVSAPYVKDATVYFITDEGFFYAIK